MKSPTVNTSLEHAVAQAVAIAWPDFERDHPALARAIDQSRLHAHVTRSLADDPAFLAAYTAAVEARVGGEALANLVDGFVRPVLRRLL